MSNLYSRRKRIQICLKAVLGVFLLTSAYLVYGFVNDPLPSSIKVYVSEQGDVLLESTEGYTEKSLPVYNFFTGAPGCYLTCHSTNPEQGIYKISPNIYVIGLIRVRGQYDGPFCRPRYYEKAAIKDEGVFKELCSKTYQCVGNSCWAGPDTGTLFGLK